MSPRNNLDYPGGLKQYIRERIAVERGTGCWIWLKTISGTGFPKARVNRIEWSVNRLAYVLWHGPIPEGKAVRQDCLNRLCCRPEHLIIANRGKVPGLDVTTKDRFACKHGHKWPEHMVLRIDRRKKQLAKVCRECDRISSAKSYAKAKAKREQQALENQ